MAPLHVLGLRILPCSQNGMVKSRHRSQNAEPQVLMLLLVDVASIAIAKDDGQRRVLRAACRGR